MMTNPRIRANNTLNGLLLVDKPREVTSFDVIRRLRPVTGVRKIGHAGTLDPLATGLMLVLFGSACKRAGDFSKLDKRYRAKIHLGANSITGDAEGVLTPVSDRVPTEAEVRQVLTQLTGEITQVPSVYSAIKIRGKEAYKRVRAGETVEMPSRQVQVYENRLVKFEYPIVEVEAKVSSGTYIRTLAEDIGKLLGTGAYLTGLVRTEVGEFKLGEAVKLENVSAKEVAEHLKPLEAGPGLAR
jgi:tRNA pseudouridine55 synthase